MDKYITRVGNSHEYISIKEGVEVSMRILNGEDYENFDIDPLEASQMICNLKDHFDAADRPRMYEKIKDRLDELHPQIEAFMILERSKIPEGH